MDLKLIIDGLAQNARPFATTIFLFCMIALLLRTRLAKKLWASIEETLFSNWQLGLLATTGVVLTLASGWTTWDGMRNFTGEPLLSGMFTFGIQGLMLIVAWLIGESFATGMNMQSVKGPARFVNPAVQTWLGTGIGLLLFITGLVLFMQWTGAADVRNASAEDIAWSKTGDKFLMFGVGLLLVALFALYAASDVVKPYIQGFRVIIRNSVLWVMFLACMATSVFFSFDSLFTSIFPQSERVRAAELRAQNQVSGIISDIEQTIASRRATLAETLFTTDAWTGYETNLDNVAKAAAQSEGAIERYVNGQIESRRRAVKEQQERMASAQSGQAGLAGRKISLTEEKGRLATQRPELATEYAAKKADVDAKLKEADAKRVEAMAEDKGVEGTGKEGRGPIYRQRMGELNLLQSAVKIAEERMKDAQKRLSNVENRLSTIDRELAALDGDLAKLKGEAETADQRIKLAEDTAKDDTGPKLDPSRILPAFERAKADFRAGPTAERLGGLQKMCGDIAGALASTPETKALLTGIDCDPKVTAEAAAELFSLQAGVQTFEQTCVGGDKLIANTSADALFSFSRKCLADSSLPSKDTDALRSKINFIELSRDDKAHRFVVTWNAFKDGNRLAYLALAIAIAIDSLVFMSGLFGANAVRSPLSDVPTYKARSASQLEATINAALGPHPYETAWLTLGSLRPMTNSDGFSATADLSQMERGAADRVRMVLTAGADIGAVETASVNPERYRVRSELREYLSTVCDKHFKTDATAKDRARLDQLVNAALAPHPREHADLVLHTLEPIRETEGFTSMVTLSDITDGYENRVVRRVMNAGSSLKAVAPDLKIDDRYYISPKLYEVLLTIRATASESANYEYDRRKFAGVQERPALDGGALRDANTPLPAQAQPAAQLARPAAQLPRVQALSEAEQRQLAHDYREHLLASIGLTPEMVDQRLQSQAARTAMLEAWKALDGHSKKNILLGQLLREFQNAQDRDLSNVYSRLVGEVDGDTRKRQILDVVEDNIRNDLALYMLFPETHLVDYLIEEIERAAQADDGLQPGEQTLRDQLKYVREGLGTLNLANAQSWNEIRQRLAPGFNRDLPNFMNKFGPRNDNGNDGEA
jgi:hypothetical protein